MNQQQAAEFTDITGRVWVTKVTRATVMNVRRECDANILELAEPDSELANEIKADESVLFFLLCAVLRSQIETEFGPCDSEAARNAADLAFADRLDEESMYNAAKALMKGLFGFFSPEKRARLEAAHAKVVSATERVQKTALEQFDQAMSDPAIEAEIEKAVRAELSGNSGTTKGFSPSTSAP